MSYKYLKEKELKKNLKKLNFLSNLGIFLRWVSYLIVILFLFLICFIFFYKKIDDKIIKVDSVVYPDHTGFDNNIMLDEFRPSNNFEICKNENNVKYKTLKYDFSQYDLIEMKENFMKKGIKMDFILCFSVKKEQEKIFNDEIQKTELLNYKEFNKNDEIQKTKLLNYKKSNKNVDCKKNKVVKKNEISKIDKDYNKSIRHCQGR